MDQCKHRGTGWWLVPRDNWIIGGERLCQDTVELPPAEGERSHYWLGATDQAVEGSFQWVDGTPFSFTDWWGGEPNNLNGEDFLAMDLRSGSWAWNDAPDNLGALYGYARGYVMERVVSGVPEPGTLALLGLGLLGLGVTRRKAR